MKAFYTLFFFIVLATFSFAQCDSTSMQLIQVRASDTDPNISWELVRHQVLINTDCTSRNKLLVHLVGSYDNPTSTLKFPAIAANNGFHVVSLKYPNNVAAQTACAGSSDSTCYLKFRKEILEGIDYSTEVDVDSIDCVYNRLLKLIQYLDANYSTHGWGQFYSGDNILWNNVITSGHSQGGGHAAVIGIDHQLSRALMFGSPNDYSSLYSMPAPWTGAAKTTHDSLFYGLNNLNDDVVPFADQFEVWNNLGMYNYGDTVLVNSSSYPFGGSRQLYTNFNHAGTSVNHSLMIRDNETILNTDGSPYFEEVWKYMLGIEEESVVGRASLVNQSLPIQVYPNPSNGVFSLTTNEGGSVRIYNGTGELIFEKQLEKGVNNLSLQLPGGVYIIEVYSQHLVRRGKVIITQ